MTIQPINAQSIQDALRLLKDKKLVAVPTETVYGLAGDASSGDAIASIFKIKGRPSFNPLIIHVSDLEMAQKHARMDPISIKISESFWPGPLTLVLPLRLDSSIHPLALAGLSTVAIRQPQGPMSQLIAKFGKPLAAPSANHSGFLSPTSALSVQEDLGKRVPLILDGKACTVGVESTIVKVEGNKIFLLRPGGITRAEIEAVVGMKVHDLKINKAILAPGMLEAHYAPVHKIRMDIDVVFPNEALLSFGSDRVKHYEKAIFNLNLSETGDLKEAAVNLFSYLHHLDKIKNYAGIAVQKIPHVGLGEAINDRLSRAVVSHK